MRKLLLDAAKTMTEEDLRRFVALAKAGQSFDASENLDKVACPVLLMGSTDDKIFKEDAFALIRSKLGGWQDYTEHLYDGYGHAVYDLAPDIKTRLLSWYD